MSEAPTDRVVRRSAPGSTPTPVAALDTPARIALYSHDSTGLGHVRRNLLLAQQLAGDGHDVLLVSGSPEAAAMPRPPSTDIVTLPALGKDEHGSYRARNLQMSVHELTAIRRDILSSTLAGYAPDLLVVDRHARGFRGELEPALDHLGGTRVVLGLRDVLDTPSVVRREWHDRAIEAALRRWYDEIWLYGDAGLHDPLAAAGLVAPVPVTAVGYLNGARPAPVVQDAVPDDRPFVLCMLGGGADGARAAAAVVDAPLPEGLGLVLVTGPQMPAEERARLAAVARHRPELTVLTFAHDPAGLLARARAAVVMGGYNTVCEVLASETPTLVVPRAEPRLEQHLRAQALAAAGLFDTLPLATADGAGIGAWLCDAVTRRRRARHGADLDGLTRLGHRVQHLLASPTGARRARRTPTTTPRSVPNQGVHHVAV
jgi:predicted glycosyltransferase